MATSPSRSPSRSRLRAKRSAEEILRERAAILARPLHPPSEVGGMGECVVFAIDGQQYAVEIAFVRESVQVTRMTPLPGLPPAFHGLANVRGQIIPVFDLRVLFNLDQSVHRSRETVLLLTHDSAEFGLLVDELLGPRAIALDRLQRDIAALHEQLLRGLSADGIIVLDVAALTKALTLDEPAA